MVEASLTRASDRLADSHERRLRAPDPAAILEAARLLETGRLVAFPTETVYGLGGDASSDVTVAEIYRAKGRPSHNPLIIHVAEPARATEHAHFNEPAERVARALWPGPLTLVLRRRGTARLSPLATAGLDTVAIRVPAHRVAQALLRRVDRPIAAPSANPSGRLSPTVAAAVAAELEGRVDLILDGGACAIGLESTVLDLSDPQRPAVLRPGGVGLERIEELLGGTALVGGDPARPAAPGQLESHYAPRLPLRLDVCEVEADEALLAFGPDPPEGGVLTLNLSASGDCDEAASRLFAALRELDRSDARRIAVMRIPARGLGLAIRDRLRRAAARR